MSGGRSLPPLLSVPVVFQTTGTFRNRGNDIPAAAGWRVADSHW